MDITNVEGRDSKRIEIFCCYARKDQPLLLDLKVHLSPLQREGLITLWADVDIDAGTEWEKEIHQHLHTAHIILLLVSPDFMASDYCYGVEMQYALERQKKDEATVIPVILCPTYWHEGPLSTLQALPTDGKAVTAWSNQGEAFYDIVLGIRRAVKTCINKEEQLRNAAEAKAPLANQGEQEEARGTSYVKAIPPKVSPTKVLGKRPSRRAMIKGLGVGAVVVGVVGGGIVWSSMQGGDTSSHIITPTSKVAPITADPMPTGSRTSTPTTHPTSSASPTSTTASTQFVPKILNTYRGHTGQVNAVAWFPNKTYNIVSGSNDGTTQVWKMDASKAFLTFSDPSGHPWGVACSPDSRYVAAASSDGMVRVWDILSETQTPLITWNHTKQVTVVAWSPNGKYIATGSYDTTVQVHPWPKTTAKPYYTYTKHASPVFALAWSPDSTKIASADNAYNIHVWEPLSGNGIRSYTDPNVVNSVDWSSDGQYLASGSNDNNNSFTLNVRQPSNPDPKITVFQQRVDDVHAVKWSPRMHDNHLAVVGRGMFVQVCNPLLGKVTTTYRPNNHDPNVYVASVDWSPDGNYIISGGSDSLVDVWSAK